MSNTIPYTHWAYFSDRAAAQACAAELTERFACLVGVDGPDPDAERDDWLLRAARPVVRELLVEAHAEVEAVVMRHGGEYDGGESGWLNTATGKYL